MATVILTAVAGAIALVVLAPLLARLFGRQAGWFLAAGLLAVAGVLVTQRPGSGAVSESAPWIPAIDVAFRVRLDGLSFLFAMLVLVLGAVVLIYSTSYLKDTGAASFYALMTAFAAAMLVLVLADDLIVLFVAWELTTLCSYFLILRSGPEAGPPATRTLLITVAGGLCLLGAVAIIVVETGTTQVSAALAHDAWSQNPLFAGVVAALVALAAMTKSAQFPFHSWLPDAMVAPAPVSAYLHAAAMVKAGIYLLMLFAGAAAQSPVWPAILITAGLVTAFMGALFALQRTDMKELLAYSTVSQLGLLTAVIGVGTKSAMLAASVHVVAHALFKSAGFMHVGLLERRAGTRDLTRLGGLARSMPWDAAMITLAALSMAGIPVLLGFMSKELLFDSLLGAPGGTWVGWLAALAAATAAVLTVAYSARIVVSTLPGPRREVAPARAGWPMSLAVTLSASGGLLLGAAVWVLDDLVLPSAAVSGLPGDEVSGLSLWHGINAPLLLSAAAVTGGVLLVWQRRRVEALLDRPLFPGTGVMRTESAQRGTIAFGRRVGDLTRTDSPAAHVAVPVVAGAVVAGVGTVLLWPGVPGTGGTNPMDVGLLVVVAIGVLTMACARLRLTAVIAAGVAGFSVALWFYTLGAADVALTQLLVEILTVVIMVLIIRRLPAGFSGVLPRGRKLAAAAVAVGAGVTATLMTLAFTGHRELSPAGEYYLREGENETGGTNVVNTILVDFRALDTLGELVVLAVAAMAVAALLTSRRAVSRPAPSFPGTPLDDPMRNALFLRLLERLLVPLMLGGSIYALLRGHNEPGGGFIAALIGASALALAYLSAANDHTDRLNLPYLAVAGSGIVVAVGSGFLGFIEGSFLQPLHVEWLGLKITSALIFDAGVYLAVFGVILAALNLLGTSSRRHEHDEQPGVAVDAPEQGREEMRP